MAESGKAPKASKKPIIGVLSAALIAATPGIYSAWENAKQAYIVRQEQKVRDSQEVDLQKWARANKAEIDSLKDNCVTHKELLDILLKWDGRPAPNPPPSRPDSAAGAPSRPQPPRPAPHPADGVVGDLVRKAGNSKPVPKQDYPELRPADDIRQQQKMLDR